MAMAAGEAPLCARSMKLEAVRGTRSRKSSILMSPMLVDSVAVGLLTAREGRMAATANMAIWIGRAGTVSWAVVPRREEEGVKHTAYEHETGCRHGAWRRSKGG